MAKKKFCGVYRKASEKFKKGVGTSAGVVVPPSGWPQAKTNHTVANPPASDQRTSYSGAKKVTKT